MTELLETIIRWLLRQALNFIFIALALWLGSIALAEWKSLYQLRAEAEGLKQSELATSDMLLAFSKLLEDRTNALQHAPIQALDSQLQYLDREIQVRLNEREQVGGWRALSGKTPIVESQIRALRLGAEVELLNQAKSYTLALKTRWIATQTEQVSKAELERLRQAHSNAYLALEKNQLAIEVIQTRHPILTKVPFSAESDEIVRLEGLGKTLAERNFQAYVAYNRQLEILKKAQLQPATGQFIPNRAATNQALTSIKLRYAELEKLVGQSWLEKLLSPLREVIPLAIGILIGVILTPICIKAFFFYCLAPLAARRPPIALCPNLGGSIALEEGRSSVARTVSIDAGQELLIHPEYLQGASDKSKKKTRWLLNWHWPFSSLAAHLYALTSIQTESREVVVVAAKKDPFMEIGLLSIPAGSAVVMQAHSIVGVRQLKTNPARVVSHWRINHIHAWLTLQLRYSVFHGPVTLVVQGSRGVRIERADSDKSINQAATIGFSANAAYSTRRSGPFGAYLMGKQDLLNDNFRGQGGAPCYCVYEEMPHRGKRGGMTGRGLEGLTDALLKVFGGTGH